MFCRSGILGKLLYAPFLYVFVGALIVVAPCGGIDLNLRGHTLVITCNAGLIYMQYGTPGRDLSVVPGPGVP